MANDSCDSPNPPAQAAAPKAGAHMVKCVKFDREMEGLERVPWRGELGKRVYENVSKEAWKMWVEYSKMLMNEYRLNGLDPNRKGNGRADGAVFLRRKRQTPGKDTWHRRPREPEAAQALRERGCVLGCSTRSGVLIVKRSCR